MVLGIYVHIPFCIRKCFYCDFVSYALHSKSSAAVQETESYLHFLLQEALLYRNDSLTGGQKLKTLYIGGGTPTCLAGGQLFALLDALQKIYEFEKDAEITVEANPGTLDAKKLQLLKKAGCNRLSLGVQSFDAKELECLGRIHSPQEIYTAFSLARESGFNNINLDLMYGLPEQTLDSWQRSLRSAVAMQPEHLSLYQLNIEQGTRFAELSERGLLAETEQETARKMFEEAIAYLRQNGYGHYEISNFAQNGRESRHNLMYWQNRGYIGLGAGASGYLHGIRYSNEKSVAQYQKALMNVKKPVCEEEPIGKDLAMSEQMFLGLRVLAGVDKHIFRSRFAVDIETVFGEEIERLKKKRLLLETDTHVLLSPEGLFLANEVFMEFIGNK